MSARGGAHGRSTTRAVPLPLVFSLLAVLVTALAAALPACTHIPPEAPVLDGGADAGAPDAFCVGRKDGVACLRTLGAGLCRGNVCGDCRVNDGGAADDALCSQAFGVSALCRNGFCVRSVCTTDSDCETGQLCGVAVPGQCGPCAQDAQCQAAPAYGPQSICNHDRDGGLCATASCAAPGPTCTGAGSLHLCCSVSGALACVAGNCCQDGDCGSGTCIGHTCSSCARVTTGDYFVDPVSGSDSASTGAQNCAFKTLSHAVSVLGASLASDVRVHVLSGDLSGATLPDGGPGSGELFPISLPAHVQVIGPSSGTATLWVPPGMLGLRLAAPNVSVSGLVVNGNGTGGGGITASTGSASSTSIDHVQVTSMAGDGIVVDGNGILSINGGVSSSRNGSAGSPHAGLVLRDNASANLNGSGSGPDMLSFSNNGGDGIEVMGAAVLSLSGVPGSPGSGSGSIVALGNQASGLWVNHTTTPVAPSFVDGLVVSGSHGTGDRNGGVSVTVGSSLTLRNSVLLGNQGPSLRVSGGLSSSLASIDLGTDYRNVPGNNSFQGSSSTGGAGICISAPGTSDTLSAQGNLFGDPQRGVVNCTEKKPGNLNPAASCTSPGDFFELRSNALDVSKCSGP